MIDKSTSAFDPRRFLHRFGGTGHNAAISLRYFDHGADWVELMMEAEPGELASARVSGGPTITLLDMAGTLAVWCWTGRVRPVATLELRVEYLAAIPREGKLHARARCERARGDVVFVDAIATEMTTASGFAHSSATFIFTGP